MSLSNLQTSILFSSKKIMYLIYFSLFFLIYYSFSFFFGTTIYLRLHFSFLTCISIIFYSCFYFISAFEESISNLSFSYFIFNIQLFFSLPLQIFVPALHFYIFNPFILVGPFFISTFILIWSLLMVAYSLDGQ